MKILVVGANGQIGSHFVKLIQESGKHTAKAMIRKAEQKERFEALGAETVLVDLEGEIDEITQAAADVDAIVFTAGSGPKTGPDKTIMIDLDGAVKTIDAAARAGVTRFIMISSFDTTRQAIQEAPPSFAPYVIAKHYADNHLRASELDYTIIHPGKLSNDPGTGKIQAAPEVKRDEVPREDIAEVIFETVENDKTIGKEFQVVKGNTAVKDALRELT